MFGLRTAKKQPDNRDLGFGSVLSGSGERRLLNRVGTFNSERRGLSFVQSLHPYESLLMMPWSHFLVLIATAYLCLNAGFALAYVSLGTSALAGPAPDIWGGAFLQAFFFSIHTLSTVGYGNIVPSSVLANLVMTTESFIGLLSIALTTGLVFARFSRPSAKVLFSGNALVAPYQDGTGFMFRIANMRKTQVIELEAQVVFTRMVQEGERTLRRYYQLPLERSKVMFFPLAWTIVHPIDKNSPFYELTKEECLACDAEVLVLLKGIDETFSETVHARSSYRADELVWNAKFTDIYLRADDGAVLGVDLSRLDETDRMDNAPVTPK